SELFICDIDGKHLAISDFNEQKINIYSDSYGNNVGIGNFSGLRMHLSLGISKIEGVLIFHSMLLDLGVDPEKKAAQLLQNFKDMPVRTKNISIDIPNWWMKGKDIT